MSEETKTTCPYCEVGCGVIAQSDENGIITTKGDPDDPANYGRLCSKDNALAETTGLEDRLLFPEIGGQKVDWDTAQQAAANGLNDIREQYGPDTIGIHGSGQLLTEDYYVANRLHWLCQYGQQSQTYHPMLWSIYGLWQ